MTSPEVITYNIESDEESETEEYLNYTPCKVESTKGITSYILDYENPNDLYVPLSTSLMKLINLIRPVDLSTQATEWLKNTSLISAEDTKDILKKMQKYERGSFEKVLNKLFLKILLCRWKKYRIIDQFNHNSARNVVYCNIFRYLKRNWSYLQPYVKIYKKKCLLDPKIDFEELLVLSSSYRQLKAFLCSEPNLQTVYQKTTPLPHPVRYKVSAESLNNWPFVSIKIDLPAFGLARENCNHNEFKIVNLEHHHKHVNESPMNIDLHYKQLEKCGEFLPSFVSTYLNQFKNFLFNASLTSSLKDCLFVIISQFIRDIACIEGAIAVKTDYYMNFAPYPYVRYLAYQSSLNLVEYNQTVPVTKETLNVRLQQLTYPAVKFQLSKFNAIYETDPTGKISFKFSDSEYSIKCLENSVIYECQLCSKVFKSKDAAVEMSNHVAYLHGYEPSWTCTKCDVMLPSEVLSRGRWTHKCVAT
ncbi:uncharacterized protein LOC143911144 [Arctopsyche grandis]|uniref:uncharacterized protein LOC143911144 n=1 Tax=Arctopsyche grandis TaxID=121162 RepID=UPI00406D98B7